MAEVVETTDGLRYRLADGREFTSPSSAGKAVTGKSCNGWAFWVARHRRGQGRDRAGAKLHGAAGAQAAAPEAGRKTRANEPADEAAEEIGCQECEQTFATTAEASEHFNATHAQPSEEAAEATE